MANLSLPRYLETHRRGELAAKVSAARQALRNCRLCPRRCGVNRLAEETGRCKTGRQAMVASSDAHFGEEAPLVGRFGSGTIFFTHCSLGCCFCQNEEISHRGYGVEVSPAELASIMIALQNRGCHNVNLVTPTHVTAQILEALPLAIDQGLKVPLVYNCSGYERVSTLRLLEGVVDIYMPDFKFWDAGVGGEACDASDYREVACRALLEMHRQVGDLKLDAHGIAVSGLLVRHLVLPDDLAGSEMVLGFIAERISKDTYVNVMDQYRPCARAAEIPALARPIRSAEFRTVLAAAQKLGLRRLDPPRRVFRLI
ncbi:MAG: radical SAM protein [Desulfosarcinaceae bacterium]|nr:radical SAM protein [Desulfosarcinaceae bacterium]